MRTMQAQRALVCIFPPFYFLIASTILHGFAVLDSVIEYNLLIRKAAWFEEMLLALAYQKKLASNA